MQVLVSEKPKLKVLEIMICFKSDVTSYLGCIMQFRQLGLC